MLSEIKTQPQTLNAVALRNRRSGFTLIEILVVVAIIGLLAAFAVPSYNHYVTKANRTDAMNFLSEVAGEQQRYYSQNNQYASKMSQLGYGTGDTLVSPESHYVVSVSNPDGVGAGYVLLATPVTGGRQAKDTDCNSFRIRSSGVRDNIGGSNANCW